MIKTYYYNETYILEYFLSENIENDVNEIVDLLSNKLNVKFISFGKIRKLWGKNANYYGLKFIIKGSYQYMQFKFDENRELIGIDFYFSKAPEPSHSIMVKGENLNTITTIIDKLFEGKIIANRIVDSSDERFSPDYNLINFRKYVDRAKKAVGSTIITDSKIIYKNDFQNGERHKTLQYNMNFLPACRKEKFYNDLSNGMNKDDLIKKYTIFVELTQGIYKNDDNVYIQYQYITRFGDEEIKPIQIFSDKRNYYLMRQRLVDLSSLKSYNL
jgi:hypothetical protein